MGSLLVPELSQALSRFAIVAPTERDLLAFLEAASFELTTELGPGQALDLRTTALKEGPLRAWMSFTLGRRGRLDVRLSVYGIALEAGLPSSELLNSADGYFFHMPPGRQAADALLRLEWSPEARKKPALLTGLGQAAETDLQAQALRAWSTRHFPYLLEIPTEDRPLSRGLDWLLSF
jgi:hypothetical protein